MAWRMRGDVRRWGWSALLFLGAAAAWRLWPAPVIAQTLPESIGVMPTPAELTSFRGAASCAAMACHNANGPAGSRRSEYSTWATDDPHHRAYSVLLSERSNWIERNFRGSPDLKAAEDTLCLSCHVDTHVAMAPHDERTGKLHSTEGMMLYDGVGCESCHGSAERWLTDHYSADWRQKSPDEKRRLGMLPTKDVMFRAQQCIGCHVGSEDRDVNHDLLAAGHPRLNFEYAGFMDVLPKHWNPWDDRRRYPDFEARVWAIGQLASARAALNLLAYRARTPGKPWPEFAEYNCYSCHHGLAGESWRQERDVRRAENKTPAGTGLGAPEWNTWYLTMLPQALAFSGRDEGGILANIGNIGQQMSKRYPRLPNRQRVADAAADAAHQMNGWVEATGQQSYADARFLQHHLAQVARAGQKEGPANWDEAAQLFLALAALNEAAEDLDPQTRDPQRLMVLDGMRNQLLFSHSAKDRVRYDSPDERHYRDREQAFQEALRLFQRQLGP